MAELTQIQEVALKHLQDSYRKTKFNYYPKVRLKHNTGVADKDLYALHKKELINRSNSIRDTLIMLTEEGMRYEVSC